MKLLFRSSVIIAALTLAFGSIAEAKLGEYGQGARAVAMGNAQVAAGNDGSAVVYNPAALIQGRDYYELGIMQPYVSFIESGTNPELYINDVNQESGYGPSISFQLLMPVSKRIVVGASIWMSTDKLLATPLFFGPQIDRWGIEHTLGQTMGIGVQITKKLSIGYTTRGALAFNSSSLNVDLGFILGETLNLDMPKANNVNPNFELDIIGKSSYALGMLYRPMDWMSLGLNYAYRAPAGLSIPVQLAMGSLGPDINVALSNIGVSPTIITGGIALFPTEGMTLAFDLSRALYSGENNKAGLAIVSSDPRFSSDFPRLEMKDVWWSKFGVEWKDDFNGKLERFGYAVRAGYSYYPTPYPTAKSPKNMAGTLDNDAHFYTGGLMFSYRPYKGSLMKSRPVLVGVEYFYEYIHLVEREHKSIKADPSVIVTKGHVVYNGFALTAHY